MNRVKLRTVDSDYLQGRTAPFLGRIKSLVALTSYEERFVEALELLAHDFSAGSHVHTEEDPLLRPWVVASGWACRVRALPDGRRQIVSFLLPGDIIGVCEIQHAAVQPTIQAVTELKLLNATRLVDAIDRQDGNIPNIVHACQKLTVWSQAQLLDHILRLGRLTALERMAHLILELDYRMQDAGLAQDGMVPVPLTQSQFGEALGLSLVHVNRTLQHLRHDHLIELKPGRIAILDRQRLALLCDFRKPAI